MDREDAVPSHLRSRRVEVVADDQLSRPLAEQERRVAFVEMPRGRRDAQRPQGANTADPEDQLLVEPHLAAADVEDVGGSGGRRDR